MKIYDTHPSYKDYLENEKATFEYISARGLLNFSGDLHQAIELESYNLKSKLKKSHDFNLNFHASFKIDVQLHVHEIILGANLRKNFEECSYFFAILGRNESAKNVIRKYHFDYAVSSNETNQPVPSYHLQYGGELSPTMKKDMLDDSKLDGWLSIPRLNFYPINFALLLDIIFCECRTEQTHRLVEDEKWRDLIFKNEDFLSKRYYTTISNHVNSPNYSKKNLIRDFCYGG